MSRKKKSGPNCAAPRPTVDELLAKKKEFNRVSIDFLKIDVATALTFAGIARETEDAVKKQRNQRAARKAYDSIHKLSKGVNLTGDDARILASNLARLKSELRTLGEIL